MRATHHPQHHQRRSSFAGALAAIGLSLLLTGCSGTAQQTTTDVDSSGASASDPPPAGMIVFTKAGGPYADDTPFVSGLDGTDERQLADAGATCCIRLSPDKASILGASLAKDGRITTGIFPLSDGPHRDIPLPDGTLNLGPGAWVPNGKRIVVQGWDDDDPSAAGMYVVNSADGGHRIRLTHAPAGTGDIPGDVSPDGKWLIFLREKAPSGEATSEGSLFIMRLKGAGGIRRLVPASFVVGLGSMRFSPDGAKILFHDGRTSPRGALWTIHPDGSHLTKIFDDPDLFASFPTWSPDGSQILLALSPVADFYTHPANAFYVIHADGSGLRKVLDDGEFKREAEWFTPQVS